MKKSLLCTLLLIVAFIPSAKSQHADLYNSLKSKFQDDPAVFIERSEQLSILIQGDSLAVTSDVSEDMLHLKDQADAFATGRVYGSHFNQVKDIKAKTLVWEKSRFREMNVSDFKKNSDRDAGIFYDDSYYYSFDYPSVARGNRTQLKYRSIVKDVRFIPGYIFSSYLPQAKTTYTVKTTKHVTLEYRVVNDPQQVVKFRKFEKGGFQYYEWTTSDVAARENEDSSPSIRYYAPHLICYVKSFETSKGKVNVLSGLNDLYQWYYSFVRDLNQEPSTALKEIADKIKREHKSELDVVRAVYYWVQDNIQYVAFEEGMRGLIPHTGQYVYGKRYGDCKDMANLIVALLKAADIKAYPTWIGTRDLPYKYSEVPTPLVDNHMIATYIDSNDQYYFLDATSDHTPFGLPSSMIQGKEALIGFDKERYEVRIVPVMDKEINTVSDSISIYIDENSSNQLIGTGTTRLTGYPKVFGAYELDRAEKDNVKKYVTRLIGKGSNKFYLDKFNLRNLDERDLPTRIDYNFRIGDYFQKIGSEIYLNLNLSKDYYNAEVNTSLRKTPREEDYKYAQDEYCDFLIPTGYELSYLPPDAKFENDVLGIHLDYEQKGNHILLSKKIYRNFLLLMPGDFERWNDGIKQLSEIYKESIILKKK
ncbi:MAG TPA: transglutaminase-like domain-containing protein [Chryseolinea sp.]|nr:transglutaminase-like domain-containing protein [Chryseolinea sp.]